MENKDNKWMWIMLGLSFIAFCCFGAWVNTPQHFSTYHYLNVDMDDETKESLIAINDMQCEKQLKGLHSCLFYNNNTNTFYRSVCYIINRNGEVLKQ